MTPAYDLFATSRIECEDRYRSTRRQIGALMMRPERKARMLIELAHLEDAEMALLRAYFGVFDDATLSGFDGDNGSRADA